MLSLCENNGSALDCTKSWSEMLIPSFVAEKRANGSHFSAVVAMCKRNDRFAMKEFAKEGNEEKIKGEEEEDLLFGFSYFPY
jgi:hypothetical protein